ncbi:inactive glucose-1-phosphate adenylyltransferase small subunit 2, chloroplastic [Dioscorea cayenensis subsp. rotundata]|uniref:Inactive glucose-1-phosphate adenylyltransferase small subunit 2, chloroplastic n=1 Tax=Dioscorea cayennensis subsp. rotundata TaxID=55577 RepID=A0AB40B6K0_DIOCR|nr:inactive glucose-1-phosphate adenylyltransferase small subunit 2, chloroplastic [Dioscorea cayenensis subsp. rotundata]
MCVLHSSTLCFHGFSRSFRRLTICNSSNSSHNSTRLIPPLNQSVVALILGDGPESKLYPLTKRRSEAAIPIGARYRLIDIAISNCINSDITKIYTLTQTNSTSLNSHVSRAYSNIGVLGKEGFIDVLAACQNLENHCWYKGNVDMVRKWLWLLEKHPAIEFLILPGHHLYNMDYRELIKTHRDSEADITVSVSSTYQINSSSSSYGFLILDNESRILGFKEESSMDIGGRNMGIYVFKKDSMVKILKEYLPKANDFENEVIKGAISMGMKVQAYMFDGKWEDMNSIESFYHASMEINLIGQDFPIYTMPLCLPPTQISHANISQSIIGDGCIINRCKISNSIIGMRTFIADGVVIEDSFIMGGDFHHTDLKNQKELGSCTPIGIGEQTLIRKAIIDKNACIGKNVKICNSNGVQESEREVEGYIISGGIVTVLKNAVIPDNSII